MRENRAKREFLQDEGSLGLLLMVWGYRIIMLAMLAVGVYVFQMLPITVQSTEAVVTLVAYMAMLVVLQDVYRACDIGQAQVSELLMSQLLANLLSMCGIYLGVALYEHQFFPPWTMMVTYVGQFLAGCLWTVVTNHVYYKRRRRPRVAVIFSNDSAIEMLYQTPYFHEKYEVIRQIREPEDNIEDLRNQLADCEMVFTIGIPAALTNGIAKLCLMMGIKGYFMPHLGQIIMSGAEHRANFSIPMLRVERAGGHSEYRALKRLFDVVAAFAGIIVTLPIMAVTALAIWLEDHGPVFYRQVRLTKDGEKFKILKFRSMRVNAEQDGVARLAGQNDSRITKVGKFIRACRIDELPQLFNILCGDMSVVGPRPERPEIARQYEETLPEFSLRLQVKAGLTGLAQVYGRYNTEPYNKLQMDLMYINEMSFLKDMQLILATVKILFLKDSTQGIGQGQDTALRTKQHDTRRPA